MRSTARVAGLRLFGSILAGIAVGAGSAAAQCMLANPSFELAGSGGHAFAGWSQGGVVGSSPDATHGAVAALAVGPGDSKPEKGRRSRIRGCALREAGRILRLARLAPP